ncbi:Lysosomal alpha-glucosidase [Phytophthora nicotianae]|uniref:Lysosomal alpha-glucosidase n=1 Tax=Phytophthora nicotianae TaxID=4792 RepID=A0A0W8CI58_PHYNI|nr:Lysosomal alpha-glucosidase [Phytophthora nicotianae]
MASELPFPLYAGFFPQMVLTVEELMHYRRFGKERVAQLVRIIDDADCVYRWTDIKARNGRGVQKAQFLDIRPSTKQPTSQQPSTILKSSVHIVDVQPDEILQAIAKVKTRDARRTLSYLHGDEFVDTQTLLTFPTSSEHKKPSYSYRAIKWCLLKAKRREGQKSLDFCYLEYAGKRKAHAAASSVVGFCVQESIARDREVPTLERYDILRGQFIRTGILITKTHQSNILKVTAIAQVDGAMIPAAVRMTMEEIMVDYVAAVHRVKGLLERQRMGRLQYLDEWDWVSTKDRKACAVCLRGFYFHRKHHCATCGEVVCSNCAPLRELEEPLDDHTYAMRVCSVCMAQAGSHRESMSGVTESEDGILETTTITTNVGTDTYIGGLRYPKHRGLRRGGIEESIRGSSSQATPVRSPLPPFRQRHRVVSSRSSAQGNGYDYDSDGSEPYQRAASESARRERRSSVLRHSTLSSSAMSAQSKKEALDKLVEHVRQIRDTINVAISEAEEEEERHSMMLESGHGDPDAGAERYDEIYDRIMKIRETLDMSSSDFDAVLESIGHNDPSTWRHELERTYACTPSSTVWGHCTVPFAARDAVQHDSELVRWAVEESATTTTPNDTTGAPTLQLDAALCYRSPTPTPVQGTTIYVFDPEDRFQRVQRRSLDQRPIETSETVETRPDEVPSGNDDGEEANPVNNAYLSSSDEEQGQARNAATTLPPSGGSVRRGGRARDESGELRELMEGLAKAPLRSRCSSGQSTGAPPTEKFDF